MVPAAPDRPKTATTPEEWAAHAAPACGLRPRVVVTDMATSDAGLDGAEPSELRRCRSCRPGGRGVLGARLRPSAAAR